MTEETMSEAYLKNIARDIQSLKSQLAEVITYMHDAEAEVPEKIRRFMMYMHDVHDTLNFYRETGQEAPPHVKVEAERCDDRYRHLLTELYTDGGTFEKVRREMSKQPGNRWDHTRLLPKQGE